jgi:hypothetical protein
MSLAGFRSKKAESQLLKEGDNVVHVISSCDCTTSQDIRVVDNRLVVIGDKANQPEWKNSIDQTALHVGNDSGSLVHRASHWGCRAYSGLTQEELDSKQYVEKKTFACKMVNGRLEREFDPAKAEKCRSIIEDMLFGIANGAVDDRNGDQIIEDAIARKSEFIVTVKKQPWTDPDSGEMTTQMVITAFKPLSAGKTVNAVKSSLEA